MSALLKGIILKHKGDFYCLNYFHSYSTKEKLKKHRNVCENHDYCYVEIPEKDNNNPEKSSTTEINKYTPSGYSLYSLLTHCSFDATKNKLDYYRGKNCMKNFYLDLKEYATKIINYEKKEMIPLTRKEE